MKIKNLRVGQVLFDDKNVCGVSKVGEDHFDLLYPSGVTISHFQKDLDSGQVRVYKDPIEEVVDAFSSLDVEDIRLALIVKGKESADHICNIMLGGLSIASLYKGCSEEGKKEIIYQTELRYQNN